MRLVEIQECCNIFNGSTPSRNKKEFWDGDISWFTPKDLSGLESKYIEDSPEYITKEGYNSCSTTLVPIGSLLFTSRAPIGHIAINKKEACTNQGFKTLVPKDGVDVEYLYYVLKKNVPQLQDLGNGATFKELSKATISKFKIPLPPLDQQKKIAAILDAADAYRQKTKALIEKYDELTQSLFLDMFGDNNGDLTKLGKVIKTVGGGTPSKDIERYWNGEIPWASVKDLKSDRLNKTQDSITQSGVDNSATRVVPKGSLIVATRMAVGKATICEMDVAINQDLKAIEIIGEINTTYLLYLFKSKESYFDSVSSGATVKGIKIEHIMNLNVNLPDYSNQNQFAERVQAIEEQKAQAEASLTQAEDLFNSLLQRAFKGELTS